MDAIDFLILYIVGVIAAFYAGFYHGYKKAMRWATNEINRIFSK